MNWEGKRKGVSLLYEDLHLQSLLGNSGEGTIQLVCTSWRRTTQLENRPTDSYRTQRVKETKTFFFDFLGRKWQDFLIKKDSLLWVKQKNKFKKKKKRVQSAIALIVVSWPDEASLCGMVAEECWPGASFWRRDGSVDDSHLVFSECSQQSPLWTLTLACNWKCNHN